MTKNIIIVALGVICAFCLIKLNSQSKAIPGNVTAIDWPEEMPIATNGDKFTAELKDGVLHVGFDNSIKETFKR